MDKIIELLGYAPYLIAAASTIAAITPTPKDDGIIANIYKIVDAIALNFGYAKDKSQLFIGSL